MLRGARHVLLAWQQQCIALHSPVLQWSRFAIAPDNARTATGQPNKSPILRPLDVRTPKAIEEIVPELAERKPKPNSKRTGLVGVKIGMVSEWDEYGVLTPLTVLWFDDNQVTQVKAPPFDCTTSVQVGCGSKKQKQLNRQQWSNYMRKGLPMKAKLAEFRVTPDALLPLGTRLNVAHFVPGQHVDIVAKTKGKGFQGGMKRWGFKGGPASHGTSLSHRTIGAVGAQGYARVLPGKKMPGRMGNKSIRTLNSWVYRVDPQRNLMWVYGSVQGPQGAFVSVVDAYRKVANELDDLPFPTHIGELGEAKQARPRENKYDRYRA